MKKITVFIGTTTILLLLLTSYAAANLAHNLSNKATVTMSIVEIPLEPNPPGSKEDCFDGGWQNYTRHDGTPFPNQGQCVSYMEGLEE